MYRITTMSIVYYFISTFALLPAEQSEPYSFIPATPHDSSTLIQLALDSHDNYQTLRSCKTPTLRHELFTEGIVEMLFQDEKLIGFYACMHSPHTSTYTLSHFFIRKEHQKNGFGRILFNRMTTMASRNKEVKIVTWISDSHAQGFYQKMGASVTGYHSCIKNPKTFLPIFHYVLNGADANNSLNS